MLVARDVDRPVAIRGFEVLEPRVGRLQDMAVGVHHLPVALGRHGCSLSPAAGALERAASRWGDGWFRALCRDALAAPTAPARSCHKARTRFHGVAKRTILAPPCIIRLSGNLEERARAARGPMTVDELLARFPEVPRDLRDEAVLAEYAHALGPLLRVARKPSPCMGTGGDAPHVVLHPARERPGHLRDRPRAARPDRCARLQATLDQYRQQPATFGCSLVPRAPPGAPRAGCGADPARLSAGHPAVSPRGFPRPSIDLSSHQFALAGTRPAARDPGSPEADAP